MEIGLLWFDNDKKSDVVAKVQRAAEHYQKKYGQWPDLCLVHPSQLPDGSLRSGRVAVEPSATVLLNHFWLGHAE